MSAINFNSPDMKNFNNFLNDHKTYDKDKFSHLSISQKSKYAIPNDSSIDYLFDCLGDNILSSKPIHTSIAEKFDENITTMLRFDFDFSEKTTEIKYLYNKDTVLNDFILPITNYLSSITINLQSSQLDCVFFSKAPYIKNDTLKNGFHLMFPNLFISHNDFTIIEKYLKNNIFTNGFDEIRSKAWLLYGCSKSTDSKPYLVDKVFVYETKTNTTPEEYFKNFKLLDSNEKQIIFTKPIEYYYPRIFSIYSLSRFTDIVPIKLKLDIPNDRKIKKPKLESKKLTTDFNEYKKEIMDIITKYMEDEDLNDAYELGIFNGKFLPLKRKAPCFCPVTNSRIHDRRDAYISLVEKTGLIYLGCYCDELNDDNKKTICINPQNPYKKIETSKEKFDKYKSKNHSKTKKQFLELDVLDQQKLKQCSPDEKTPLVSIFYDIYGKDNIKIIDNKIQEIYIWINKTKLWSKKDRIYLSSKIEDILCPYFRMFASDCKQQALKLQKESETIENEDEKKQKLNKKSKLEKKSKDYSKIIKHLTTPSTLDSLSKHYFKNEKDVDFLSKIDQSLNELPILYGRVINLEDKTIRDRTKDDLFSFELKVDYKMTENGQSIVKKFMYDISNQDSYLEKYLHTLMGYCLTGEISDRAFYIFWGDGRNGKSSLTNVIEKILGEYFVTIDESIINVTSNTKKGGASPELIALKGKRCGVLPDNDDDNKLNSSHIKKSTSGDTLSSRFLFSNETIKFKSICKQIYICNNKPSFNTNDNAIIDRIKFIPFLAQFEVTPENTEFCNSLTTRYINDFFYYFVEGAYNFYKDGKKLIPAPIMIEQKNNYIEEINFYAHFISENYEKVSESHYEVSKDKSSLRILCSEVHEHFKKWYFEEYKQKPPRDIKKGLEKCLVKKKIGSEFYLVKKLCNIIIDETEA